jgi:hypothetical protein
VSAAGCLFHGRALARGPNLQVVTLTAFVSAGVDRDRCGLITEVEEPCLMTEPEWRICPRNPACVPAAKKRAQRKRPAA